jgi:hypothetical protein
MYNRPKVCLSVCGCACCGAMPAASMIGAAMAVIAAPES